MLRSSPKSVLALDYGDKRVGLALANLEARLASPLTTLPRDEAMIDNLRIIIERENVVCLVVGLPRNLNAAMTAQSRQSENFADELAISFTLPIKLQDEALTSIKAEKELIARGSTYLKEDIDALAATYILDDWLQQKSNIDEII